MSDTGDTAAAGWFHAEGDPPGTQRYWDGTAWQGEPQLIPEPQPAAPQVPPPPSAPPPPGPPPGRSGPGQPLSFGQSDPFGQPSGFGQADPFGIDTEPKKKKSRWKLVVGIIVGLMLLIGGCTFVLWRAVSGPIDTGNDFLADVKDGDYPGAWSLADPDCFQGGGPNLLREVFGPIAIESYRLSTTSVDSTNGRTTGETSGTITFAGGDTRSIDLFLIDEDGWLVCGFDLGAPGSG